MLFSSITFIYYFLPILFIFYFLVKKKYQNLVLLIFSFIFYAYGEPKFIIMLLLTGILNYVFAKLMDKYEKHKKLILIIALIYNIGQLFYFKYIDFFILNLNNIFGFNMNYLYIALPLGISFYTFQSIGYIVDVYKKEVPSSNSIIDFLTYLCLFPQLVAGPIVRYKDVNESLKERNTSFELFSSGIKRFLIGLAKKMLIANNLGLLITSITYDTRVGTILIAISWTLQIYFDFSGYSDMAIGLGKMFGFNFLENFKHPLWASSIRNFWKKWHISLSSFFKDYVYIPLGGSKCGTFKYIRNILIVWLLTGFWHGANYNFILWGLYFAILLLLEKFVLGKYLEKTKTLKYFYTLFLVIISFVIFSIEDLNELVLFLKNLLFISDIPFIDDKVFYYLKSYSVLLVSAFIFATPLCKNIIEKLRKTKLNKMIEVGEVIAVIVLITLITAYLVDSSFNPFLYFRF